MSYPASEFRCNNQTRYGSSKSLIPRCKLIFMRWFSPLQRLISSDKDELSKNDKQWEGFSVPEMVDDLFSENAAIRARALRKTRQLVVDFPDLLKSSVIRIETPRNRNRRLNAALASVILQFEHPITAFRSEFTPILFAHISYPEAESIRCVFDTWTDMLPWHHRELISSVGLSVLKSIVKQTNPNTSVTTLRSLAGMMRSLCPPSQYLWHESAYEAMVPALKYPIKQTDTEVLRQTLRAVNMFAGRGNWCRGLLIDRGILHHLITLLSHSDYDVVYCAIVAVHRFLVASGEQMQAVWESGFLNHYPNALRKGDESIFPWVIECLRFLAAGNRELLCALLERGLFPRIMNRPDYEEIPALTADDLMKFDNCKEVPYDINGCIINELCRLLKSSKVDKFLGLYGLSKLSFNAGVQLEEARKRIEDFYCGAFLDEIQDLQWSVKDDESRLSYHIMEDYFG